MTREEAIEAIKCNWPDSRYTILREALDMAVKALEDVTDKNVWKMTNADRIRSMTDEELAWELMLWRCEAVAMHHGISSVYPDTQKTILEWLQQPAEEDDHDERKENENV